MEDYEDEIVCDLAEYYSVLNFLEYKPSFIATLVLGLRDNSRLMMKLANRKITLSESLEALTVDALNLLLWVKTKDSTKGRNKPRSLYDELCEDKKTFNGFNTIEEYEKEKQRILEGIKNG